MRNGMLAIGCALALGLAHAQDSPPPDQGKGGVREACKADFDKFCPNAQGGARISCMRQHKDELSQACQDAIHHRKGPPPGEEPPPPKS
jgi:Cysteine rich repeat